MASAPTHVVAAGAIAVRAAPRQWGAYNWESRRGGSHDAEYYAVIAEGVRPSEGRVVGSGRLATGAMGPPCAKRFDIYGTALNDLFKMPAGDFVITPELTARLQ
jgi:hypothetical protein